MAGGQVDGPGLGIRNQGGDKEFTQRFAIHVGDSAEFDPVKAMRWSMEHSNPLVAVKVAGNADAEGALPAANYSLLNEPNNQDSSVLLWALKPSEEGVDQGIIARSWNVSDQRVVSRFGLADLKQAHHTSHIETDGEAIDVNNQSAEVKFAPQQMRSIRLKR